LYLLALNAHCSASACGSGLGDNIVMIGVAVTDDIDAARLPQFGLKAGRWRMDDLSPSARTIPRRAAGEASAK